MRPPQSYPKIWAITTSLLTILAGVTTLVLADFGAPLWVMIPLLAWLASIGLPTTLAVLLVASFWGRIPGFYGLLPFLFCSALVALGFQTACFLFLARHFNRRKAGKL